MATIEDTESSDELTHYGVKGMKWGVSRKTTRRLAGGNPNKPARSKDSKTVKRLTNSKAKQLSNKELKKAIERMQLEKQYKDLNPGSLSKAKKITVGLLATGATVNGVIALTKSPAGQMTKSAIQAMLLKLN